MNTSVASRIESSSRASWRPGVTLEALKRRARMLADIRRFFQERDVLEVETPVLSRAATVDPAIASFVTRFEGAGGGSPFELFLQTSPEFFMKRLLADGAGAIYQIARVFRNGEAGRRHNPEFTLLEWYRPGFDEHHLMDEIESLLHAVLPGHPLLATAIERITYRRLFLDHAGLDPVEADVVSIRSLLADRGVASPRGMPESDSRPWLDLVLTHLIEPAIGKRALFVHDYPADQAALARIRPGTPPVAERFELYLAGWELANGFHELTDASEQRRRFLEENRRRQSAGEPAMPVDEALLQALEAGLPDCAGVALGVDRLLMVATGASAIDQVIPFAWPAL